MPAPALGGPARASGGSSVRRTVLAVTVLACVALLAARAALDDAPSASQTATARADAAARAQLSAVAVAGGIRMPRSVGAAALDPTSPALAQAAAATDDDIVAAPHLPLQSPSTVAASPAPPSAPPRPALPLAASIPAPPVPAKASTSPVAAGARLPRVLVVDHTFPVALGAWRLSELHTLMWHCDADVLVPKRLENYAGASFPLDYESVWESHGLHRYAAHVFDPAYNGRLAGLNARTMGAGFNGSEWNGRLRASYLLRRAEHAAEPLNLTAYDAVWVIFMMLAPPYLELAGRAFNPRRMVLHLYPGGGFHTGLAPHDFGALADDTTVLVTASFTAEYMRSRNPRFKRVVRAVSAAQMLYEGTPKPPRKRLTNASAPLVVCMTSLGSVEEKGADSYVAIAEAYTARYGATAPAVFLGVGRIPPSKAVTLLGQMSQAALSELYASRVDVAFNLERARGKNGWPLASEAMLQGCVLISTDMNGENAFYRFGEEVTIVADRDIDAAVAALHALATDRARLHRLSGVIADRAWAAFSFDGPGRQYLDVLADTIAYAGGQLPLAAGARGSGGS